MVPLGNERFAPLPEAINDQGLSEHSDALVHAVLTFAQTTSAVNGTEKGSPSSMKPFDFHGPKRVR